MIEPIRIQRTVPQGIAYIPLKVAREQIREVMGPGLAELRIGIAAQNIAVTGPWFTHHLRAPGETFDFEICLPVEKPVVPAGRIRPGEWPAMLAAQTIYHGGFEGLGQAWGEFLNQLDAAGHRATGELWERYLAGPEADPNPANWRTEFTKRLIEA